MRFTTLLSILAGASALWFTPARAANEIVVGFATAASGFMQAYDKPAQDAALIRIEEINKAGGLLGKKIKPVFADTKTDQAEGAKAGLAVLDQGADLVIVSCDYDFGAPAALQAQAAGKVSFFLCAESIKAGIPGVGPFSFSASVLAPVQGATMSEWAYTKKNARSFYRLLDSWTVYNKGICDGFDWMLPRLKEAKLVGSDTFKNDDASIASQITRIKSLPKEPDAIMLCTMMPGAVSAIKQIRAAGIKSMILNGSGVDGSYWMNAVPDLSNFYVPVQGSVYGDDPNPKVNEFNKKYKEITGGDPSSQYVYPGYVLIDVWAKAVERAKSTDAAAVVAELEKMNSEPTLFGPRTFTKDIHHQNQGRYLIVDTEAGKPQVIDQWTISEKIPLDYLVSK
ncbi:branched-chain amino acid transport system substrate-binding protein [Bradyrhizobium japonicum]|jgi:branched-chain amino acid transport system substrate-binding protein|uniref:Branched-chain amino acid transport system substrate-binding protein n=1 Tax=Bradyrhizobium elkanii TaxID=29448 RepID=A0A4Q4K2B0_BRAEL|nr:MULTISPECIES: ABC transporter substrate-binding protein [Bradyrhizobium]MBP1298520.1 branched-chain amino acid transport system substrate-binding protein [Bradyrhizobium elkanii]MBP2427572.1 branched-chain amino acid transport system substrate-binding protein [Bradyrhizobium elkanii]MCP1730200.1 branched-chain amino acid transport system substrate-binding protein [Bradyrhizobium elkanii]MCP1930657.1 branched-chain amino acid transport system substrate-binding protein [Bradyrhizobium elkanii]